MKKTAISLFLCIVFLLYLVPATSVSGQAYDTQGEEISNCPNLLSAGETNLNPSYFSSYMIYSNSVEAGPFTRAVMFTSWNGMFLYLTVVGFGMPGSVTDDIWVEFWINLHSQKESTATDRYILSPSRLASSGGLFVDSVQKSDDASIFQYRDKGLICDVRRKDQYNNISFKQYFNKIAASGWVSGDGSHFVATAAIGIHESDANLKEFKEYFVAGIRTFGLQFTVGECTYTLESKNGIVSDDGKVANVDGSVYYLTGGWFANGQTNATISNQESNQDQNQKVPFTDITKHSWFVRTVTLTWDVPIFTLTYGSWNPETHAYDGKAVTGTATVTVTNQSKLLDVNVIPNYSRDGPWSDYFDAQLSSSGTTRLGHLPDNSGSSRANSAVFRLTMQANSTTPSALNGTQQAGTFTVTLSSPYQ